MFAPWSTILMCEWVPILNYMPRTKVRLVEKIIPPESRDAATTAIGQFVPVYDHAGRLLAQPTKPSTAEDLASPQPPARPSPFQFDLQTLLILTVVVACAANCYGLRYRRLLPEKQAMAALEKFHPTALHSGEQIISLDFSSCQTKPSDAELGPLSQLPHLTVLRLEGTLISDAGLNSLHSLKSLTHVSLVGTHVTQQGVDELKRALPNASVVWMAGAGWGPQGIIPPTPTAPPPPPKKQ